MTNILKGGFLIKATRLTGTECQYGPFLDRVKADEIMGYMSRQVEYSHVWIEPNEAAPALAEEIEK